jgi:hypothetical protein
MNHTQFVYYLFLYLIVYELSIYFYLFKNILTINLLLLDFSFDRLNITKKHTIYFVGVENKISII